MSLRASMNGWLQLLRLPAERGGRAGGTRRLAAVRTGASSAPASSDVLHGHVLVLAALVLGLGGR